MLRQNGGAGSTNGASPDVEMTGLAPTMADHQLEAQLLQHLCAASNTDHGPLSSSACTASWGPAGGCCPWLQHVCSALQLLQQGSGAHLASLLGTSSDGGQCVVLASCGPAASALPLGALFGLTEALEAAAPFSALSTSETIGGVNSSSLSAAVSTRAPVCGTYMLEGASHCTDWRLWHASHGLHTFGVVPLERDQRVVALLVLASSQEDQVPAASEVMGAVAPESARAGHRSGSAAVGCGCTGGLLGWMKAKRHSKRLREQMRRAAASRPPAAAAMSGAILPDAGSLRRIAGLLALACVPGELAQLCDVACGVAASSCLPSLAAALCGALQAHVRRTTNLRAEVRMALVMGVGAPPDDASAMPPAQGDFSTGFGSAALPRATRPRSAQLGSGSADRLLLSQCLPQEPRIAFMLLPEPLRPSTCVGVFPIMATAPICGHGSMSTANSRRMLHHRQHAPASLASSHNAVAMANRAILHGLSSSTARPSRLLSMAMPSADQCTGGAAHQPFGLSSSDMLQHQLDAEPLALRHTLLQRLEATAAAATAEAVHMPSTASVQDGAAAAPAPSCGLVVADCRGHMQDAGQPCRDLYMLARAGLPLQSLVLLGLPLEQQHAPDGQGGLLLAVYVTFGAPLPEELLQGVKRSCEGVMAEPVRALLAQRLCRDFVAEVQTLRAGMPGRYAVTPRRAPEPRSAPSNLTATGRESALMATAFAHVASFDPAAVVAAGAAGAQSNQGVNGAQATSSAVAFTSTASSHLRFQAPASPLQPLMHQTSRTGSTTVVACLMDSNADHMDENGQHHAGLLRAPSTSRMSRRQASGKVFLQSPAAHTYPATPPLAFQRPPASAAALAAPIDLPPSPAPEPLFLSTAGSEVLFGTGAGTAADSAAAMMAEMFGEPHPSSCPTGFINLRDLGTAQTDMRAQMDLLVSSFKASMYESCDSALRRPGSRLLDGGDNDDSAAAARQLVLGKLLGKGGFGAVFQASMGPVEVAVKLCEVPLVEPTLEHMMVPSGTDASAAPLQQQGGPGAEGRHATLAAVLAQCAGRGFGAAAVALPPAKEREMELKLRQKRNVLMQQALEMAIMSGTSHPNIVQVYKCIPNVVLEDLSASPVTRSVLANPAGQSITGRLGLFPVQLSEYMDGGPGTSPLCNAVVMELCDRGSLLDALAAGEFTDQAFLTFASAASAASQLQLAPHIMSASARAFRWRAIYLTLLEVAMALQHLHAMGVVHRDTKPANILLRSNPCDTIRRYTVKLADFGYAALLPLGDDGRRLPLVREDSCGTLTHMPPEAFTNGARIVHSFTDVYAFGILMWEMLAAGQRPYAALKPHHIPMQVVNGARPSFGQDVPLAYRALAHACWRSDPMGRPTMFNIIDALTAAMEALPLQP